MKEPSHLKVEVSIFVPKCLICVINFAYYFEFYDL